jgi:dTDP-4-dehydrorhamnose 3,5-epimerase
MPQSVNKQAHAVSGVLTFALEAAIDARGSFTEIFRNQWTDDHRPAQWNLIHSHPNSMRGIHVHARHSDYLVAVSGNMQVAMKDLRRSAPSFGQSLVLRLGAAMPSGLLIPPGIAHGFFFDDDATHLYSVSEYWCPEEEMGCHWRDPSLQFDWSVVPNPVISQRDDSLGSLAQLRQQLEPFQHLFRP